MALSIFTLSFFILCKIQHIRHIDAIMSKMLKITDIIHPPFHILAPTEKQKWKKTFLSYTKLNS